jgi:hypothetical protein
VPVTVTVYDPGEPLQDNVEVPDPVTLFGVSVQVNPLVGLMFDVKLTTPLNP